MKPINALCAIIAGAVLAATAAMAQQWPSRPILVVSPYTPGNATDIVGRIVLDQIGQQIGQSFVIENRAGGGGVVGVASVVRAEPDGYTLLLSSSSMSSAVITHASLPYDALRDLAPVAMFGAQPSVLVAAPSKGFKTVADLVAAAKAKPGTLNFASAGIGSASHIAGEKFRLAANIDVQHVPFRGPEALNEVLAGRIDFYFVPLAPAVPLVTAHKVVALAVSTPKRAPLLPDVPTIAEAGYPTAQYLFWGGLSAPAKTPPDIVNKLHDEVEKALDMPAVREKLQHLGVQPMPMTVAEYGKFFADDMAATIKLGKDAHIVPTD
ncbi:MAG TPA: tripartite tricarboxylate transporter substrate-binding protein [Xanthobacteraceae bacterium]|nr:tripartite tricarboxylate transporter substrate-binding protein [Xanthobacteraceae bacterium]